MGDSLVMAEVARPSYSSDESAQMPELPKDSDAFELNHFKEEVPYFWSSI